MIFEDHFFENLPTDKYEAGIQICQAICDFDRVQTKPEQKYNSFDEYIDAFAALDAFIESNDLQYKMPILETDKHRSIQTIMKFCYDVLIDLEKYVADKNFISSRDRYKIIFSGGFIYRFTNGDLLRIQELINELRKLISESELFTANHKERLLKKLENLQKELHKKMSSLDKFWGLIGEAGIVIGKFGQDAKPFVDRIKEIAQIIWRTQSNAEELPSGAKLPLLKSDD